MKINLWRLFKKDKIKKEIYITNPFLIFLIANAIHFKFTHFVEETILYNDYFWIKENKSADLFDFLMNLAPKWLKIIVRFSLENVFLL